MNFSSFGKKLTGDSGILRLMDDLGRPLPEGVVPRMLGGGNPARITKVEQAYRREMESLLSRPDEFENAISRYDAPQGRIRFIESLVGFFRGQYGWDIGPENIAITNGSQSAFFYLFNLFSENGKERKTILFPLVPEYVGYADQGIDPDTFVTLPARTTNDDEHTFKYRIDLPLVTEYLADHPEVGALCVSRPTNPTGNVLTDDEIRALARLAARHGIPLMIDNAYGMPFPDIIFPDMLDGTPAPYWDEHTILSMSLSKIGLPSLRTGIVIASAEIVRAISSLNSIVALASGSLGQVLAEGMILSGELKSLASDVVQPFYRGKSREAQAWVSEFWEGRPWQIHRNEGSIFLWLYLPDLTIPAIELYAHLKSRGVVVVPGEYFFFGREKGSDAEQSWKNHPHREKCLRLNYSRPAEEVREGLRIISEVSGIYR
ncbi:MAG TPA: valine--pyruvate transaminase [Treponemataceae bacterium]|nr:valine--pyruvate transaminase [Treponemataceae bacterium]